MIKTIQEETNISSVLTYRLIAQTPYIHFQYSQDGATVRATEVKPKLDKFLKEIARKEGTAITDWLVRDVEPKNQDNSQADEDEQDEAGKEGKKERALDYKLRIVAVGPNKETWNIDDKNDKSVKFFFGNMRSDTNQSFVKKDFVFKDASLQIICKYPGLLALIKKHIKAFFVLNNFGNRQSKGFGGFLIQGTTKEEINQALCSCGDPVFWFPRLTDTKKLFEEALAVYSIMKGGINETRFTPYNNNEFDPENGRYLKPGAYIKGYIQREFLPDPVGSDKAFVKAKVVRPVRAITATEKRKWRYRFADYDERTYSGFTFVRALLGLADHYEYRDDIHCNLKETRYTSNGHRPYAVYHEKKVHICNYDNITINADERCIVPPKEIEDKTGIKRFKSPITIKIFSTDKEFAGVNFIFDDSYSKILGKTFLFLNDRQKSEFKCETDRANYEQAARILEACAYIRTPDEFDRKSFVEGFIRYFNDIDLETLKKCNIESCYDFSLQMREGRS